MRRTSSNSSMFLRSDRYITQHSGLNLQVAFPFDTAARQSSLINCTKNAGNGDVYLPGNKIF